MLKCWEVVYLRYIVSFNLSDTPKKDIVINPSSHDLIVTGIEPKLNPGLFAASIYSVATVLCAMTPNSIVLST